MYVFTTIKKYKFGNPVSIERISSLLKNAGIEISSENAQRFLLKHEDKVFLIRMNNSQTYLWLKMQMSLIWYLMIILIPVFALLLKMSFENYLNETLNLVISIVFAVVIIGWIIYKVFFQINKMAKPFVQVFEKTILKH
jgi:hypothetical protein